MQGVGGREVKGVLSTASGVSSGHCRLSLSPALTSYQINL